MQRPRDVPRVAWFRVRRGDRAAVMRARLADTGAVQLRVSFGYSRSTPRAIAVWHLRGWL